MQGLEAGSHNLQHRTCSGLHGKQRRLVVSVLRWFHGSNFWRVLRRDWPASVLRLRGIVQRGFVHLQTTLHHRLQRQGDCAACGGLAAAKPTAITAHTARYGLLIPAAVAASWYGGRRIAASAPSVASHAARNEHRIAASSAATQRGILDIAAASAFAAAAARNCVRVASTCSSTGRGVSAVVAATANASGSCLPATRLATWSGLRRVSASAANHHAVSRLPVPDCGMLDDLVQRDRSYRGRWCVSLQHR